MSWVSELLKWPTVIWAGMITLIFVTLSTLTLFDNKPFRKAK